MTQNISNKAANSSSGSRAILIALTLSMIKSQTWIIKVQDAIQECVCHLTKSTVYSVDTIVFLRRKGGCPCLWEGNWLHWSCLMVKKKERHWLIWCQRCQIWIPQQARSHWTAIQWESIGDAAVVAVSSLKGGFKHDLMLRRLSPVQSYILTWTSNHHHLDLTDKVYFLCKSTVSSIWVPVL